MDAVANYSAGLGGGRGRPRVLIRSRARFCARVRYVYIFDFFFAFCFFAPACAMFLLFISSFFNLFFQKNGHIKTVCTQVVHILLIAAKLSGVA